MQPMRMLSPASRPDRLGLCPQYASAAAEEHTQLAWEPHLSFPVHGPAPTGVLEKTARLQQESSALLALCPAVNL